MKKILALVAALSVIVSVVASGSIAYLSDTDSSANVMTLGNVDIMLHEQEFDENGRLVEYTQEKSLFPLVGDPTDTDNDGYLDHDQVLDKIVTIQNTGKSDAYVRAIIAYEGAALSSGKIHIVDNDDTTVLTQETIENVVIDGVRYDVIVYTYKAALAPNATTAPSLKQIWMDPLASSADVAAFGNTYDTLVVVQGVQTNGFEDANTALNTAFGSASEKAAEWFGGMGNNNWDGYIPESQPKSLILTPSTTANQGGTITINDADALVYLNKLRSDWEGMIEGHNPYYYHWAWTIELGNDIDLLNKEIESIDISYWGAFDGKGHTISNVNLKEGSPALFTNGAKSISNLTVKNIVVNAPNAEKVGSVVTRGSLNNVHVLNASVTGGKNVGGLAGQTSSVTNCSVKNSSIIAKNKTSGGLVGYSIGDPNPATVTGNKVEDVTVFGTYNVGGLLGQAQNETVKNNTVKHVTVISTEEVPDSATASEARTGAVVARNHGATVEQNTTENVTESNAIVENDGLYKIGDVYFVSNANGLKWFSEKALTGNNGTPETAVIDLTANIDMQGADFSAIVAQRGDKLIFNGNGHTISNVKVVSGANDNTTGMASMFYAYPNSTLEITNLTLKDIVVDADANASGYAAAVVGYCEGTAKMTNVDVVNAKITGVKSSGMLVGHLSGNLTATNCDLSGTVTLAEFAEEANGHYAGKYIGTLAGPATLTNCTENVTVSGNLNAANEGSIFGRKTDAGSLN